MYLYMRYIYIHLYLKVSVFFVQDDLMKPVQLALTGNRKY